jgi:hypothetical protein
MARPWCSRVGCAWKDPRSHGPLGEQESPATYFPRGSKAGAPLNLPFVEPCKTGRCDWPYQPGRNDSLREGAPVATGTRRSLFPWLFQSYSQHWEGAILLLPGARKVRSSGPRPTGAEYNPQGEFVGAMHGASDSLRLGYVDAPCLTHFGRQCIQEKAFRTDENRTQHSKVLMLEYRPLSPRHTSTLNNPTTARGSTPAVRPRDHVPPG